MQQQGLNRSASATDEAFGSSAITTNASRLRATTSSVGQSGTSAISRIQQSAGKAFLDSGIESSVAQTSPQSHEAQRLLDPSGIKKLCNSCEAGCCQYQSAGHSHDHRQNSQHQHQDEESAMAQLRAPEQIHSMSLQAQTIRLLPTYFVAELIGTFLLILIGDGAIAAYTFTNRPVDVFSVCLAFGVGAMIASYTSTRLSGAHLNPAISIAYALDKRLKWELVPVYMIAQYMGGVLATLVLFLNYSEAIFALDNGEHSAYGKNTSTGAVFATYPAPYVSVWGSLLDQVVGTAVLLFALSALSDKMNLALEDRFQPPIVALAVGLVCFAFSVNCGAIFNPARDLSPRLVTWILGYPNVWEPVDGTYWYLAAIIGPHIGAVLGLYSYKYCIGLALEASQRHLQNVRDSLRSEFDQTVMSSKSARFAFQNPHQNHLQHNSDHDHNYNRDKTNLSQLRTDVPDYGSSVMR